MSTMVLIFADGAQIHARICAPGARFRGGGGGRMRCYMGLGSENTVEVFVYISTATSRRGRV